MIIKIPKDKQKHYFVSAILALVLILGIGLFNLKVGIIVGLLISTGLGLAKEFIYDRWMKRGTFDVNDIIFNLLGVWSGALLAAIITELIPSLF